MLLPGRVPASVAISQQQHAELPAPGFCSIGTAQLDGAATATQGIQELLDPLRTAINTLSTVQTETSANVDALSVGQQEQLRQLAESSQTALASATAGLAEDIAAQKLVLEKAVEDHAAAAAQRDALTEAVAGCASSSALAEALKAQVRVSTPGSAPAPASGHSNCSVLSHLGRAYRIRRFRSLGTVSGWQCRKR